jgi:hypothetical protein
MQYVVSTPSDVKEIVSKMNSVFAVYSNRFGSGKYLHEHKYNTTNITQGVYSKCRLHSRSFLKKHTDLSPQKHYAMLREHRSHGGADQRTAVALSRFKYLQ